MLTRRVFTDNIAINLKVSEMIYMHNNDGVYLYYKAIFFQKIERIIISRLRNKYDYLNFSYEEIRSIVNDIIADDLKNLDENANLLALSLKQKANSYVDKLVYDMFLTKPIELLKLFINTRVSVMSSFNENLGELRKIDKLLQRYKLVLSRDEMIGIINGSNKLFEVLSKVVYEIVMPDGTLDEESLIYGNNINDLIACYCVLKNIKINACKNIKLEESNNLLNTYLSDVRKASLSNVNEKELLIRAAENDDQAAKKLLVEENLKLVIKIAKKYESSGMDFLDLVQDGNIALIEAINSYDYKKGGEFMLYISFKIHRVIIRAIENKRRMIKIPVNQEENLFNYKKTYELLREKMNREPTDIEVATVLGKDSKEIKNLKMLEQELVDFDYTLRNEEENFYALQSLDEDVEGLALKAVLKNEIASMFEAAGLTKREIEVLKLRYGFYNGKEFTLRETGEYFGITYERVRKIENRALKKLRCLKSMECFSDYMDNPEKRKKEIIAYRKQNKSKIRN